MTTLEVACAVEGDYAFHSAAMIDSVLAHRGELGVRIHYLHGPDFPDDIKDSLAEWVAQKPGCSVSFVFVDDERCAGLPTRGFTGKATWYRIFLPELLPSLDRVLCLDVDLLAVDALGSLYATDLGDALVAAVTNVLAPMYMSRPAALGLNPLAYFNAGVMLLNLDLMRRGGCSEAIRTFAVEHASELALRDQDALNFVLADRRLALHPRWNAMNALHVYPWASDAFSPDQLAEARARPAIRHFEGPGANKPWHYRCDRRWRELYAAHRGRTPWPRYRLEGKTPAAVIRRYFNAARRRLR